MKDLQQEEHEYRNARPNGINGTLDLWERVQETNPLYTKKAKVGGHSITAIAPQYQIFNATQQFGSYGETWGFKDIELDYSITNTPVTFTVMDYNTKKTEIINSILGLVGFKATFFYPNGSFEITNSIKIFTDNKHSKIDDNYAKKIETDALTKALSKLGFNADIFMGKFDDVRYVEEMKEKYKEEPKPKPLPKLDEKMFNTFMDSIGKWSNKKKGIVSITDIEKIYQVDDKYKEALETRYTEETTLTEHQLNKEIKALEKKETTLDRIKSKYVLSTVQEKALELIEGIKK